MEWRLIPRAASDFKNLSNTEISIQKKLNKIKWTRTNLKPINLIRGVSRVIFGFMSLLMISKKKPKTLSKEKIETLSKNIRLNFEIITRWLIRIMKLNINSVIEI